MLQQLEKDRLYQVTLGDEPVLIGQSKTEEFQPQVTMPRWGDAAWTIQLPVDAYTSKTFTVEDSILKWSSPTLDLHIYEVEATRQYEHGAVEFMPILKQMPLTDRLTLPLDLANLDAQLQPPLNESDEFTDEPDWTVTPTDAYTAKGINTTHRPVNVVNSVALYHATARGNQYRAGKHSHLLRPLFTDRDGKSAWGDYALTQDAIDLLFPMAFLKSAVYPVRVDPTFGKTDVGGSGGGLDDRRWSCVYTMGATAGTADTAHWYCSATGVDATAVKIGFYDSTPTNLQGYGEDAAIANAQWEVATLASEALAANTAYRITVCCDSDPSWGCRYAYDAGAVNQTLYTSSGITYADEMKDPWDGGTTATSRALSIYITYTEVGGVSVPVMMHHYAHTIGKIIRG